MRQQHDEDSIGQDHAGSLVVSEIGFDGEADRFVECFGAVEVRHRQVHEDHLRHGPPLHLRLGT